MKLALKIKNNPSYTIAALLGLFGEGSSFDCIEAPLLKMIAGQYEKTGHILDTQLKAISRILPKYYKEFPDLQPIQDQEPKNKAKFSKSTWMDKNLIRLKTDDNADAIRTQKLFNRRYSGKNDTYSCSFTLDNIINLKKWGFILSKDLRRKLMNLRTTAKSINPIEIDNLPGTLREYQKTGVAFIDNKKGRCLLGDDMGIGKTIQALAYCHLYRDERPMVIVTTGASKLNWSQEANLWIPGEKIFICEGKKPKIKKIDSDIIIINYDILPQWVGIILSSNPKILIGDEIHYIKNPKTNRSKAFVKLGEIIKKFIGMSGTPFDNRPIELFTAANLIAPWLFPSYWDYAKRYCDAHEGPFGWDITGSSHMPELHSRLNYIMIRRLKSEVLEELPEKIRSMIPVEYDKKIYKKGVEEFRKWRQGTWIDKKKKVQSNSNNPAQALVQLEKLKFSAAMSKIKSVISWITDYLENEAKLVVFAEHIEIKNILLKHFGKIAISSKEKDSVYKFQKCKNCLVTQDKHNIDQKSCNNYEPNLETRLFIGGKDAKEAITLTAARATATIEFWWVWSAHAQAEDRVYRIGQEHDSVNAYYFHAQGTIDDKIIKILDHKRSVTEQIIDGVDKNEVEMLQELLNELV